MKVSSRGGIAPFLVMDVLKAAYARAAEGAHVIHFEAGEPGGPAPGPVREAAARMLAEGRVGYTEPLGLPQLRSRIARFYGERHGIEIAPARVAVTAGASAGFLLSFLAAFDPGARVALAEPGYPAYRNILRVLGLEPVILATTAATRYQPTPDALAQVSPLDGVILQNPANPTGTMVDDQALGAFVTQARERGIWLVVDEIYHGITFGRAAETALRFGDEVIVVNSFSKYFCMTGWRIGWLVLPERLVRPVERLAQNLFISPSSLSQCAALAAFDAIAELDQRVDGYAENRAILLAALAEAGVQDIVPPDGAFYIYADFKRWTNDSEAFCARVFADTDVALTPGTDFDPVHGRTTARLSFAGPRADVEDGARRLVTWLKNA